MAFSHSTFAHFWITYCLYDHVMVVYTPTLLAANNKFTYAWCIFLYNPLALCGSFVVRRLLGWVNGISYKRGGKINWKQLHLLFRKFIKIVDWSLRIMGSCHKQRPALLGCIAIKRSKKTEERFELKILNPCRVKNKANPVVTIK